MTTRHSQRGALFAAVVAATVLALASTALACTGYRGVLKVTDGQGDSIAAYGAATGTSHEYCPDYDDLATDSGFDVQTGAVGNGIVEWGHTATLSNITVNVTRSHTCSTGTSTLPNGNYFFHYTPGSTATATNPPGSIGSLWYRCMSPPGTVSVGDVHPSGTPIPRDSSGNPATFTISASSTGPWAFTLAHPTEHTQGDTLDWESRLCINNELGTFGNEVVIKML